MNVDTNKFVGGYKEGEVTDARREALELQRAVKRLVNNEDFMLMFNHYTEQTVLEEADKAGYVAEHRPMLFESILNRVAFKQYINEVLAYELEEDVTDEIEAVEG